MSEHARRVRILRSWLAGTPLADLPEGSEAIVRQEAQETLAGLVKGLDWTSRETHTAGQSWLDRRATSDFMRGFFLGVGRGLQMAATSTGHLLNWATRRGFE